MLIASNTNDIKDSIRSIEMLEGDSPIEPGISEGYKGFQFCQQEDSRTTIYQLGEYTSQFYQSSISSTMPAPPDRELNDFAVLFFGAQ